MRDPSRVLQNPDPEGARPVPRGAGRLRLRESERALSPFEIDTLLLGPGPFGRRNRAFPDFQDNYSGDFHLFRIY